MKNNANMSTLAKKELATIPFEECCRIAMLSAIVHTAGTISFSSEGMSIIVQSGFSPINELVGSLFEELYGIKVQAYADKVVANEQAADILIDLGILRADRLSLDDGINPRLIEDECCKRAYLAGAYLGCGALSIPKNGYNLEFSLNSRKLCEGICRLLDYFEIPCAKTVRCGKYKAYLRHKDAVSDALAVMGANKAVLEINVVMAERDLRRSSTRRANCDMANVDRLVNASIIQQEAIKALKIIKSRPLRAAAEARLKYPDYSYEELSEVLGISKGAIKYRLNKIVEMYLAEKD